jgi:hypothetical protein
VSESHQSPGLVIARPSRERPAGVTILAVLFFVAGIFYSFGALIGCAMTLRPLAVILINPYAAIFVFLAAALSFVQGALFIAVGIGFLKLQNWARVMLIVLIGLALINGARALVTSGASAAHGFVSSPGPVLIVGSIVVGLLVYLFRPHVKQAFGATRF